MKLIFGIILFMVLCVAVQAQSAPDPCPKITVVGPSTVTQPGGSMVFTVRTSDGPPGKIEYDWSVSQGTIVSGQWTPAITVQTTPDMGGTNVTATVKISGLAAGCVNRAGETAGIAEVQRREPYDSFGKLSRDDVKARIDNFYIQLLRNPDYEGLIVVSLNEKETLSYKIAYLKNLYHAIDFLRRDPARVTFIISVDRHETDTTLLSAGAGEDVNEIIRNWAKNLVVIKGEEFKQKINTLFPINK